MGSFEGLSILVTFELKSESQKVRQSEILGENHCRQRCISQDLREREGQCVWNTEGEDIGDRGKEKTKSSRATELSVYSMNRISIFLYLASTPHS